MIVRDEAVFIKQCLNSIVDLVDEIVITDTGSIDDTKLIASKFDAKIHDFKWSDDFSGARNSSIERATGDWILVLDADETISKKDHKKIRTLIEDNRLDAYSLVQRTYGDDLKHSKYIPRGNDSYNESRDYAGWIASPLVRLFRNKPEYRFRYKIHEVIEPSIEESNGEIQSTEIPIHHFTYEKPSAFVEKKHSRYLDYGLQQIKLTPNDPKPYLEVALVYLEDKEYENAEKILLGAVSIAKENADIYDALATLYIDSGRPADAERVVRKGLSLRPDDVIMLNKLASTCMARRAFDEAERLLKQAKKISPEYQMVYNNLGLLYAINNQPEKAISAFKNSLKINSVNAYALTSLGMLYVNAGKLKNAQLVLEKTLKIMPDDPKAMYHLALVYAATEKKTRAIKLLMRAREVLPTDPAISAKLAELKRV